MASEQQHNAQAMFNLAYMHEQGKNQISNSETTNPNLVAWNITFCNMKQISTRFFRFVRTRHEKGLAFGETIL